MNPELELLKPALEIAMIVARQGDAPRSLQPFLRFTKLPPLALSAAQAALEDDDFRAEVTDRCDEREVGRAGWLFLTRPDGWSEELAAMVEERRAHGAAEAEHSAQRELDRAHATIAELEARATVREREIHDERGIAAESAAAVEELERRLERAEAARSQAVEERARAVRERTEMERRLAQKTDELRQAQAQGATAIEAPAAGPDEAAGTARLARLRAEWQRLAPLLEHVEELLAEEAPEAPPGDAVVPTPSAARRAVRLERGLVDGTVEAASWLLGRPGAVVLVDGYNVTMLAWPELSAADQRVALERAADRVQVTTGARLVLVFDGDSLGGAAVRSAVGSPVRVRFTDAATEADDQILAMIDEWPSGPVVVVSNNRRVRDGARARGANVVGATEFVQLLR